MKKKLELSRFNKNALKGDVYYFVDEHGLMLHDKTNPGKGDAIGRSYRAYLAYRDPIFPKAVAKLWDYTYGMGDHPNTIKGIRHPDLANDESKMSRDHYIYTLALLKEAIRDGNDDSLIMDKFNMIIDAGSEVDNMMRFTLPLVCWTEALGENKWYEFWFYIFEILTVSLVYIPMTKLGNWIAGFSKEVEQDEWAKYEPKYLQHQAKWKIPISKLIYPAFARQFLIAQIEALDDNYPKLKARLKKLHTKLVGETNYVQRMFLDMEVPRDKVEGYKMMKGGRWSGWLNNRNDRWMYVIDRKKEGYREQNLMDEDWARAVWNNKI